jgi:membrane associated rhomboid family serine protease
MEQPLALYVVMALNLFLTGLAFARTELMPSLLFDVAGIRREGLGVYRLLSSGFVHADWGHFFLNMIALYSFGQVLEDLLGSGDFVLIYFVSLLGGNLLALWLQWRNLEYRALGASGAVSGVVYGYILFFPDSHIYLLLIPFGIPAWIFGIAYIFISVYGMRRAYGNIGHEAHLGGALAGLLATLAVVPQLMVERQGLIGLLLIPIAVWLAYELYSRMARAN